MDCENLIHNITRLLLTKFIPRAKTFDKKGCYSLHAYTIIYYFMLPIHESFST